MHIETPIFEQSTGFAFNSNDFAMTFPSTGTFLPSAGTTAMENWDDDKDDDEDDDDARTNKDKDYEQSEDVSDEDDVFEQYLFGENDD